MAEQLLGAAAEALISKALSLATEQISAAWGVEQDLESLAEQLGKIQALLSDAETKSTTSKSVELWLKDLEDAATDAYYLMEDFAYEVQRRKFEEPELLDKVHYFFSCSNHLAFRFNMASKIKKINLRITGIFKESGRLQLVSRPDVIMNSSIDIRRYRITRPFVDDSDIIGRNYDVEKVVSALTSLENGKDLSVIGIVGMAGQGKTILAQLVYKNEEVTRYFEKKMWICVSDDFSVEKILSDMLQSLTGKVSMLTMGDAIVNKLKKELNRKRFLLVLDDVWNEDAERWSSMKNCLQDIGGSEGSKIVVTTRSERVVATMKAFFTHRLGALSAEDSWKLFEKIAFADGGAVKTPALVNIGERIVKRCGGLPLAIKAIGGVMNSKKDARDWSKIEESNLFGSLDNADGVHSVIKLSYDHLPSLTLKKCFAYCVVFQKDYVILRKPLIQQWMAQGLLNPSTGSAWDMEDVGNNYFNILLQRSLFQEAKLDDFGNIESCKMHDLVHDFALKVSKDQCLTVEGGLQDEDIKAIHLSIVSKGSESLDISTKNLSRLRTLFLSGRGSCSVNVLAKCKYLSVLIVDDRSVNELPNSIVKLKHLRYLDISGTSIGRLPNSITKLYNLQTLRLNILYELPKDFGNLVKLRHLYIPLVGGMLMSGIRKLSSLQTLRYFILDGDRRCQIEELQCLQNLEGELRIIGLENVINHEEALKADLSSKKNIVNLELHWGGELCWGVGLRQVADIRREWNHAEVLEGLKPPSNLKGLSIYGFRGENLPSWMKNTSQQLLLHYLVSIRLEKLKRCQKIPMLGHLPYLKVVVINGMKSVKCIGDEFYGSTNQSAPTASSIVLFPSLKEFYLKGMPSLEQWSDPTVHPSHDLVQIFPLLEKLEVFRAPKLTRLPDILNRMSSLKVLHLCDLGLSHLPEDLGGLVSLEELKIENCSCLVFVSSIWRLQSLRELDICGCEKLDSLPDILNRMSSLKVRQLSNVGLSHLPEDLGGLVSLEVLKIAECSCLVSVSSIWQLQSLRNLHIRGCEKLDSLPDEFETLAKLERLGIWYCSSSFRFEDLCCPTNLRHLVLGLQDIDCEEFPWPSKCTSFPSLEYLALGGTSETKSLPEQIQHLPALRELWLESFGKMEALPEWLCDMQSLQLLYVTEFSNLAYLPSREALQRLTNSCQLKFMLCQKLEERCREGSGCPEWDKIANLPNISGL